MVLRSFRDCSSGNVAIIFALALLPVFGALGLAVDYTRATTARTELQAAVDSAALALAYADPSLTAAQLKAEAEEHIRMNFHETADVVETSLNVERGEDYVTVSTTADVSTTFMRLLNNNSVGISAQGKAVWGSTKLEVVLVLDNSTSMENGGRLTELKKAAKELITILEEASFEPGAVKIGLAPFATSVRVSPTDYSGADWIRFDDVCTGTGKKRTCRAFDKSAWKGCILDRDMDYDVTGDGYDPDITATLAPAKESCPSSESNLGYIAPLNENFTEMRTAIEDMVAGGWTNMTIGLAFGMSLLSPSAPFTEGVDPTIPSDEKTEKIIIALSDGENTKSRHEPDNYGGEIDVRNELACTNAKAMARVYTILLVDGNEDLLTRCATAPGMFRKADSASELSAIFRAIGKEIARLRLDS